MGRGLRRGQAPDSERSTGPPEGKRQLRPKALPGPAVRAPNRRVSVRLQRPQRPSSPEGPGHLAHLCPGMTPVPCSASLPPHPFPSRHGGPGQLSVGVHLAGLPAQLPCMSHCHVLQSVLGPHLSRARCVHSWPCAPQVLDMAWLPARPDIRASAPQLGAPVSRACHLPPAPAQSAGSGCGPSVASLSKPDTLPGSGRHPLPVQIASHIGGLDPGPV